MNEDEIMRVFRENMRKLIADMVIGGLLTVAVQISEDECELFSRDEIDVCLTDTAIQVSVVNDRR